MTGYGGRHSSPEGTYPPPGDLGFGVPRYEPERYAVPPYVTGGLPPVGRDTEGRRTHGLLDRRADRSADQTGPLVEPDWWSYGSSDHPDHPLSARHSTGDDFPETDSRGRDDLPPAHPSAPLPPRPPGVWDRLHPRQDAPGEDAQTVAQPLMPGSPLDRPGRHGQPADPMGGNRSSDEDATDAHALDPDGHGWEDHTGGLDVIGAHVQEEAPRRRGRGRRYDSHDEQAVEDSPDHDAAFVDGGFVDDVPVKPYDKRTGRARRRRRPFAVIASLLVLAGLVVGIVLGGQKLIELINPTAQDYTGQGTGEVSIRVQDGDTLSDIARALADAGVIASVSPFVEAAEANAASVGIQPGVYNMRSQMSGQAALDLLLDPVSRMMTRVTLPEGLTVERTLARISEETGIPVEQFQAAAADPAALGLPAYANGQLEGFLFPATYDVEPDTAPADILRQMVARGTEVLTSLGIAEADRLTVVTKASMVQAEAGSVEDMGKVARVLENRLADGMALQLDTTVNYANGKGGLTTTAGDRANPSPYNTYLYPGLPPGAIDNPGEDALRAVLNPTPGDWRFFVVVDPDTGDTRFAATKAEHDANVELFRQWLRDNPEE